MTTPIDDYNSISPRVNGEFLQNFNGRFVLLPCEIKYFEPDIKSVEVVASDAIAITLITSATKFVEVLGQVDVQPEPSSELVLHATRITNMGNNLDLALVQQVIVLIHDSRFADPVFGIEH
ncbi:hypothetical protein BT96DRAFT_950050 [Gymnopus androsaceus JB14]|uniref:Uncharacterized protein n=1 Tax=Gymnopus androsaceus JB14 TaxID=1447944 RepID=A0A6A4GIG0_9AGAR|nr:hypothetical protein BT96DRAFT_950050 [Gymnopus androsaceus JB14]